MAIAAARLLFPFGFPLNFDSVEEDVEVEVVVPAEAWGLGFEDDDFFDFKSSNRLFREVTLDFSRDKNASERLIHRKREKRREMIQKRNRNE